MRQLAGVVNDNTIIAARRWVSQQLYPSYGLRKTQRREGKGPCLTDAAHLTFSRRPVRVLGRYAMIRTCSTALGGFLCGGGVIKTSLARDLSPVATERNAPPLAARCQADATGIAEFFIEPTEGQTRWLRPSRGLSPKQCEIDHVKPTQNAVDDRPEYRMVGGIGDRDGKGGAKAHAVFCALDPNSVVTIAVHVDVSAMRPARA